MGMVDRALLPAVEADLARKIVLITGPRQCGKTTLARAVTPDHEYVNFDYGPHRVALKERSWDRKRAVVIFDELHKMRGWNAWLKGIYDVEGIPPALLVTGSARLDTSRKGSESLARRFHQFRLHPFDVKEVRGAVEPEEALARLMSVGGFPEPFLNGDATFYGRWKRSHIDTILRQDLIEVKHADDTPSPSFGHFEGFLPGSRRVQIVRELGREKTYPNGLEVRRAAPWLAAVSL